MEDGRIEEFLEKKYASYQEGIGEKIRKNETSFEELETYALKNGEPTLSSGRQEYLEGVVNTILLDGKME